MSALPIPSQPDPKKYLPEELLPAIINPGELDLPTRVLNTHDSVIQLSSSTAARVAEVSRVESSESTQTRILGSELTQVKDLASLQKAKSKPAILEGSLAHLDPESLEPTVVILNHLDIQPENDNVAVKPTVQPQIFELVPPDSDQDKTGAEAPNAKKQAMNSSISQVHPILEIEKTEFLDLSDYDLVENSTLSLDQFLQKKVLFPQDIPDLLVILQTHSDNLEVWKFVNRLSANPLDVAILKKNLAVLDRQMLHSIMIGGRITQDFVDQFGQEKTLVMYKGPDLGQQGNMSTVSTIYSFYEDSLELVQELHKSPKDNLQAKTLFEVECYIAEIVADIAKKNPNDRRLNNILIPKFNGRSEQGRFLTFPKIINEYKESVSLSSFNGSQKGKETGGVVSAWIKSFAGMVRGLSLLSENGVVVADNKPSNAIDSENGAVIIDLGGFLSRKMIDGGYMSVIDTDLDNDHTPFVSITSPNSDRLMGIATTINYNSSKIIAMELGGKVPSGTSHKYSLAKCLERFFCMAKLASKEEFNQKADLLEADESAVSRIPPIEIDQNKLSQQFKQLYQLYLKIYLTPQSISFDQIENELNEISILPN